MATAQIALFSLRDGFIVASFFGASRGDSRNRLQARRDLSEASFKNVTALARP
ncbi:MAG TPA: hypothetical protein VG900_13900 [Hyphomicrobiaceae bacterium]|jgi:hypothetical protein|nr:hypothetical protein [Hyphomicrobiaceae bacterium]